MGKKLLVVDDKKEIRNLVRTTLEFEDWEVLEADTGDRGVEAVSRHKPNLVIMDMMMPGGIDGMQATRVIKSNPETSACKIIMLSGSEEELRPAALEAGVDEFIQKPFSPLDLLDKVETLFDGKEE
jgi:CheY-like chemotaxis protein